MQYIKKVLKRYEDELLNSIIPFWEKHCVDSEDGGYYSFLDRMGNVYDTDKHIWSEWRIVYMFSTLFTSEYSRPEWLEIAKHGFEFLTKYAKRTDGSYYFTLNKKGLPVASEFPSFSIYSESFAAIGAAALYAATNDDKCRDEAVSAYNIFKKNINIGLSRKPELSGQKKRKSLGHQMILCNAAFVLNECFNFSKFDSDIDSAIENIFTFWNDDLGMFFENISMDGSFDLDSCEGRLINPGHALEAMWFILQYAEKKKDARLIAKACTLTGKILDYGWDKEFGGIFYFKDALGKPLPEPKACFKVWWSQNEAAIAALYAYRLSGKKSFLERFKDIDRWSWKNFRDPEYGEWFGYVDKKGNVCHAFKANGWKTFFHIPRYLFTCIKLMKSLNQADSKIN
ncbi:MAG: AGE family epimerase/isomerase [Victivallales bacterium]